MRTKRIYAFFMTVILIVQSMLMGYVPVHAQTVTDAEEVMYSGTDGGLEWSIDEEGQLVISGNGNAMEQPWRDYASEIYSAKVKTTGTTSIGSMFSGCWFLETVDFSEMNADEITNSALQMNVFMDCEALKCVITPEGGFKVPIQLSDAKEGNYWSYNDGKTPISNAKEAGRYELKQEEEGNTYVYAGKDGDIYWDIDSAGVLTISGNGACVNKDWLVYRDKVKSVLLKSTSIDNASYLFWKCSNMETFAIETTFSSGNIAGMFNGCSAIKEIDLSAIPYAGMNMSYVFMNCHELEKVTFADSFYTQSVMYMEGLFQNCNKLRELDLTMFDTTQVTDMHYMFYMCSNLQSLDLSSFRTSNVMSIYDMFTGCEKLAFLDISNFSMDNLSVEDMWGECDALSNINAPENTSAEKWLLPAGTWTYKSSGAVVSEITEAGSYVRDVQYCGVDKDLTWEIKDKVLTISGNGDYEQGAWLKYRDEIESAKVSVTGITDMSEMFRECEKLQSIDFTGTDTSKVQSFFDTFAHCISLKSLDLSGFDTSSAGSMQAMFYKCESLEELDVSGFDTSNVANMMCMFYGCKNLKTLDVSNFETSKVYDMSSMFSYCEKLEEMDIRGFDTSQLAFNASLFDFCNELKYVNAPESKTEKTIWLETVPGTKWVYEPTGEFVTEIKEAGRYVREDVYKPAESKPDDVVPEEPKEPEKPSGTESTETETTGTVLESSALTSPTGEIPANSTFTVTDSDPKKPTVAFNGVTDVNASEVEIPKTITFDGVTYEVTSVAIEGFTSQKDQANYEVTGNDVKNLTVAYKGTTDKKKTAVTIPEYNTYKGIKFKVTTVADKAFKGNKKIKNISGASAVTEIGDDAFNGCTNLKSVTVGEDLESIGKNAFKNCKKLQKVKIKSKKLETIGNSAFNNCTSLKSLSLNSKNLSKIDKGAFRGCKKLTKIVIKTTKLKSVGKNAFKGINKNCTIKVPSKKYNQYKKMFKGKGQKSSVKIKKA